MAVNHTKRDVASVNQTPLRRCDLLSCHIKGNKASVPVYQLETWYLCL